MALSNAVEDARHTTQRITWTDCEGDAQDLTGATLTGRIKDLSTGTPRAIDGTLTVITPAAGIFDWAYGANDVGTAGRFEVQFIATYAGPVDDKTLIEPWTVHRKL